MGRLTNAERAVFERAWPALTPADVTPEQAADWFARHFPDRQETAAMLTQTMIDAAESIKSQMTAAARDCELAYENEALARRAYTEAKQAYEDAEAEFSFEAMQSIEGKNAETRKAALDVALIKARTAGPLASLWRQKVAAQYAADNTKMALDQCLRRWRALEAVADLSTAQLRALSR